jgi:hypothetical protein
LHVCLFASLFAFSCCLSVQQEANIKYYHDLI